jgi:acyl dehydratase
MTTMSLHPGATRTVVLHPHIVRATLVQYAGASGDYNPLHHDEPYAISHAGYPSVIAHGMFTMGLSARLITDLVDVQHLRHYGGRFHAPVHPGDALTGTVTVTDMTSHTDGLSIALVVETVNQHGRLVFSGTADAELPLHVHPATPDRE